jgi:TetR/AcrR family transcriptional regulator, regulator of cefoperazone and chloramphenicol sensitivity
VSSETDLTARARIRDAAIASFAERGIAGATIREIAERAGVSSGLLRHHFGSKDGLRDACDEYAMDQLNQLRQQLLAGGKLADNAFLGSVHPEAMLYQTYLVRSMAEGATPQLFRLMMAAGEQWLATTEIKTGDPAGYIAVLVAMQMGIFLLREQISAVLAEDASAPAGHARLLKATVDIFSQALLTPEMAAQARAALDTMTNGGGPQ